MKRTFYTIGSLIILLICAFVFVALPVMTGGSGSNDMPSLGKYDGKEIRYETGSDFDTFVKQYAQYYQNMGMQLDNSTYYYIFNYAFNSVVSKMVAESAISKSGWKPSEEAINRNMRPYFYDETGKYSQKLYKQTPDSTIVSMRKDIEDSLLSQRYNDDFFGSDYEVVGDDSLYGLKESDKELDFLVNYGKSKRGFNMAVFEKSSYPDEEKIAFGKANSSKFIKYDMSIITVDEESEAKKIMKRISADEISFEDAISEYSTKSYGDSDGKLTATYGYNLENMIEDGGDYANVCALPTFTISDITKISTGYAIFRADGNSTAPNFDLDDTVYAVSSYLNSYETSVIENYYIAKAKDFVADASFNGFDVACENAGVNNVVIPPFPLNYGNVSIADTLNTSLQGLSYAATNENFLTTAFSLKMNEFSEPIVIDNNIVVLQYVTSETVDDSENNVLGELTGFDKDDATNAVMGSPKLENNVAEVYFSYILR